MIEKLHVPGAKADSGKATYRLLVEDFPFSVFYFMHCIPGPSSSSDAPDILSMLLKSTGERPTVGDLARNMLEYFTFHYPSCDVYDTLKLRVDALHGMADVAGYGARKYTPSGWKHVPGGLTRYTEAMYRHCFSLLAGEECDQESGYPHRSHILWNCFAMLQLGHDTESLESTCVY